MAAIRTTWLAGMCLAAFSTMAVAAQPVGGSTVQPSLRTAFLLVAPPAAPHSSITTVKACSAAVAKQKRDACLAECKSQKPTPPQCVASCNGNEYICDD